MLEHGDYGRHNISIVVDTDQETRHSLRITSLYDWETGCILPALLADPATAVHVDLTADENEISSITRIHEGATGEYRIEYMKHAEHYINMQCGAKQRQREI